MKWYKDLPTKPGLWWYKENEEAGAVLHNIDICTLVDEKGPYTGAVLIDWRQQAPNGYWAGPVRPPKFEKPKVKPEYGWPRFRDIPEPERTAFRKFMVGQTCPFIPGLEPGESDFYFPWDYDNFKSKNPVFD